MNEREEALDFLARLGSHPAVAYHEAGVASEVRAILDETGVGYRVDEFGNILARLGGSNSRCFAAGHRGPHGPPRVRADRAARRQRR